MILFVFLATNVKKIDLKKKTRLTLLFVGINSVKKKIKFTACSSTKMVEN